MSRAISPADARASAARLVQHARLLASRCHGAAHHSGDPMERALMTATARQADRAAALLADACPPVPALTPAAGTVGAASSTSHP